MEERIIDDEYGRGVRLRKTKDGYVDVTDELAPETENAEGAESAESGEELAAEEISFEFPDFVEEEDEDLIGIDPAEAEKRRQEKAAAAAQRRAEYERYCAEGDEFLASGSFKAAALKYEKALKMDDNPKEASYGFWRAKTSDFTEPDVLVDEYADIGVETMEYDLGYETMLALKRDYGKVFQHRLEELSEEEKPLSEDVENKQTKRRSYLKDRFKKAAIYFGASAVPMLAALILAIVFGMKITSTPENTYVIPTIACAAAWVVFFIVFAVFTNKFINAFRMYKANEDLSATETGERLLTVRSYKALYEYFLSESAIDDETETDAEETTAEQE